MANGVRWSRVHVRGQGARPGVPVAEDAGHGRACDAGGLRPGEVRRAVLYYVSRVLRLTLLAPEIVEAILDGVQPAELQLDDLLKTASAGVAARLLNP